MPGSLRISSLVLVLVLAAGAVALAACGDESNGRDAKNAYVAKVNAAQREFANTVTSVSQRITTKSSPTEDRRTLRDFETAIANVVTKLEAIDVPPDVATEHKQLVDAMSGFGKEIKKATDALRDPDTPSIAEAQRAITTATQTVNGQIDAAIAAINSKLKAS